MPRIMLKVLVFIHACVIGTAATAMIKDAVSGTRVSNEWSCQVKLVQRNGQVLWMPCSELGEAR